LDDPKDRDAIRWNGAAARLKNEIATGMLRWKTGPYAIGFEYLNARLKSGSTTQVKTKGNELTLVVLYNFNISVPMIIVPPPAPPPPGSPDEMTAASRRESLALQRADSVKKYLIERHGIDSSRISTSTDLMATTSRGKAVIVMTINP